MAKPDTFLDVGGVVQVRYETLRREVLGEAGPLPGIDWLVRRRFEIAGIWGLFSPAEIPCHLVEPPRWAQLEGARPSASASRSLLGVYQILIEKGIKQRWPSDGTGGDPDPVGTPILLRRGVTSVDRVEPHIASPVDELLLPVPV